MCVRARLCMCLCECHAPLMTCGRVLKWYSRSNLAATPSLNALPSARPCSSGLPTDGERVSDRLKKEIDSRKALERAARTHARTDKRARARNR
jgi:hypothetical protein